MTLVFADTSALVKLYVDEPGSTAVRRRERDGRFFVSAVARVEVPSAFWRKARAREMDATDARILTTEFEVDWYGRPGVGSRFPLVAASSALMADDEPVGMACFDQRLCAAAEAEGLSVLA